MEAGSVSSSFDRLRVHSIGLPQVLFQSITHMAPAAAVAYSIYANWVALGWVAAGIVLTIYLYARYPDRLRDMEKVYVEDETVVAPVPA